MSDYVPPGGDPMWQQMMMEYMLGYNPMDPMTSMLGTQPSAPAFGLPQFQGMYGVIPQSEDALDFSKDSANYLQDYANISMDPALWMSAGTSALSPDALNPQMTQNVVDRPGMRALEAYRNRPDTFEGLIAGEILDNGGTGNSAISKMRQVIESVYDPATGEVRRELPEGEQLDPELVAQADEYRRMLGTVTIDGVPTVDYNTGYDNAMAMERAYLEDPQPGRTGAIYNDAGEMVSQGGELTLMYDENGNEQLVETRSQEAPLAEWLRKNGLSSPFDQYSANDFMSGDWMAQQQSYVEGQSAMTDAMEAYRREAETLQTYQEGRDAAVPEITPDQILGQFDPSRHIVPPSTDATHTIWADEQEPGDQGEPVEGPVGQSGINVPQFTADPEALSYQPLANSMIENIPQEGSATNWTPEPGHIFPGEPGYDEHLAQHEAGAIPDGGGGGGHLQARGKSRRGFQQRPGEGGDEPYPPMPPDGMHTTDQGDFARWHDVPVIGAQVPRNMPPPTPTSPPGSEGAPWTSPPSYGSRQEWEAAQDPMSAAMRDMLHPMSGPPAPGQTVPGPFPEPPPPLASAMNYPLGRSAAPEELQQILGQPAAPQPTPMNYPLGRDVTPEQLAQILGQSDRTPQPPYTYSGGQRYGSRQEWEAAQPGPRSGPPAPGQTVPGPFPEEYNYPSRQEWEEGQRYQQPTQYAGRQEWEAAQEQPQYAGRQEWEAAQPPAIDTGERPEPGSFAEAQMHRAMREMLHGRRFETGEQREPAEPIEYAEGRSERWQPEGGALYFKGLGRQYGRVRKAREERNRIGAERERQKQSLYNYDFGVAQARAQMARERGITPYQQQMLARRMVPMAMGLSGSGYFPGA